MKESLIDRLLMYFIKEDPRYEDVVLPKSLEEKRLLLRGMINVREPHEIPEEILSLEDQLLQTELQEKKITDVSTFPNQVTVWKGDITTLKCDAIVNACNAYLLGCFIPNHHCIDNQIHTYAGIRMRLTCNEIMQGKTLLNGEVVVTPGYNLPCKYVFQTVGPQIQHEVTLKDKEDLKACYLHSLEEASKKKLKSIAFPCISTGVYGFPKKLACKIAVQTTLDYLRHHQTSIEKVVFNVFTEEDEYYYEQICKNQTIN